MRSRHRSKRSEDRQRIHARGILVSVPYAGLVTHAVTVRDRQPIREEQKIEPPALERLGNLDIMLKAEKIGLVLRIAPYRVAMNNRPRRSGIRTNASSLISA